MSAKFPGAVPEIPVADVDRAAAYYRDQLGFTIHWGDDGGGIGGIWKGNCRLFLTNPAFRKNSHGNSAPVVIWLNLDSKKEVDDLHRLWTDRGARILSQPESKPWKLHEFTASDLDGNIMRVFYDFRGDV
jgi:predicted lactoylglutathione lyase